MSDHSDVQYLRAQFEACVAFRGGHDDVVCSCGWLEADHATPVSGATLAVVTPVRGRRPRIRVPERRAS